MEQLDDTIAAVSSPITEQRVIVRMSGPGTLDVLREIFSPVVARGRSAITSGIVSVEADLVIDAKLYLFCGPSSYTGQDVAEFHLYTNGAVAAALMANLLGRGVRPAGPGEFTARAYLNGKMDLAQAEAVNEIIVSSNRFQLAACEKLLSGRLGKTTAQVRSRIMDCLSLIEAGLDFGEEDIEFITRSQGAERLRQIIGTLEGLLSGSVSYEELAELPAVGIAGAPNAGKSSLGNALLGKERSIVSGRRKTTRDVLTDVLGLGHCKCVLFDCAGLVVEPKNVLDELAQQAASEAIRNAAVVVFCVDASKRDFSEDVAILDLFEAGALIGAATKSDLLSAEAVAERIGKLNRTFSTEFIPVSTKDRASLELLRKAIDRTLLDAGKAGIEGDSHQAAGIALTVRHRQAISEAIDNVGESVSELEAGNDEVAAMLLRAAWQGLSTIEQEPIDEQILERIFGRFCIGK
jgi:tRNA modification GTPase